MAKKESTFINMVATLFLVTFISSAAVGYVYEVTKEPIEQAKLEKKTTAIRAVVSDFDNDPIAEAYTINSSVGLLSCYPAKQGDKLVGTAIEAITNKGFGGTIKLMVGLLASGVIKDIAVLEHKETPGLGDKMDKSKSDFSLQFIGKDPAKTKLSVSKDGGDINAITAATISSRAFCDAVQRAYTSYMEEGKK
ncbi:MAG: RnfABCDGE type electron transport complex subunit G [Candidatus Omnitrophica bacterium]|nr:RnfABCDGE type electron transport complex subunit G [Candidatus Omnitrophota bacterium]MBU1996931.1 RnfABCDGE type electron transport complex subunit G [Candidatus Omnitrophota bacterium]MBU4334598.1 RnfABCDGE type electron transport complex subunit G [Candidatus Omnitrophota bacterium]